MTTTTTQNIMDLVKNLLIQAGEEEWDTDFTIQAFEDKKEEIKSMIEAGLSKKEPEKYSNVLYTKSKPQVFIGLLNKKYTDIPRWIESLRDHKETKKWAFRNLGEKNTPKLGDVIYLCETGRGAKKGVIGQCKVLSNPRKTQQYTSEETDLQGREGRVAGNLMIEVLWDDTFIAPFAESWKRIDLPGPRQSTFKPIV